MAQTHEERLFALKSMPTPVRQAMVAEMGRAQDVPWLDTMLQGGCFDYSDETDEMMLVEEVFSFLKGSRISMAENDPFHGHLTHPVDALVLTASEEFKDFYQRFTQKLLHEGDRLYGEDVTDPTGQTRKKYMPMPPEFQRMLSMMVVGACALDLPECLKPVLDFKPYVDTNCFKADVLGSVLKPMTPDGDGAEFYPYFFAMQFSSHACMDLIEKHRHFGGFGLVRKSGILGELSPAKGFGAHFTPACLPSAFEKALNLYAVAKSDVAGLVNNLKTVLATGMNRNDFTPYLKAFVSTGVFDQDPEAFLCLACTHGHAGIIRSLRSNVDWRKVPNGEDSPVMLALTEARKLNTNSSRTRYEDAIEAFFDRAIADGHPERVTLCHETIDLDIGMHEFGTRTFAQPVHAMIALKFHGALVKMLQAGLSPTEPPLDGAKSPLEIATLMASSSFHEGMQETVHVIRSFAARQQARQLLDEIDSPNIRLQAQRKMP